MDPTFNLENAFARVHERLDEIKEQGIEARTHLHSLIGNGQPGRVGALEEKVGLLEKHNERSKGYFAALTAVATVIGGAMHYLVDLVRHK